MPTRVVDRSPAVSTSSPPQEALLRADKLLVYLGCFFLLLFVSSDALLTHSQAFWRWSKRGGFTGPTAPLVVEATLHTTKPGTRDWIVIGSSVVERDIDVERLSSASGHARDRILKLPLLGATSLELAMLTNDIIALRPRAVVLLATPWTLQNHIDRDRVRFYDPRMAVEIFSWRQILAEHANQASGLMAWSNVVVRHRESLRQDLFSRWLHRTAPSGVHEPGGREKFRRAWHERYSARREDFGCENLNVRALDAMSRRLKSEGIRLVLVSTPVGGRWGHDRELVGFVDGCFSSLADDGGFTFLPRATWSRFPTDSFSDQVHMTAAGAEAFSNELGRVLGDRLRNGRES
jgi:hypothetical protein